MSFRRKLSKSTVPGTPQTRKAEGGGKFDFLVSSILRPPRNRYDIDELGPNLLKFGDNIVIRHDFDIPNLDGLLLRSSLWKKVDKQLDIRLIEGSNQGNTKYCVVYLHCNSSSRVDVLKGPSGTSLLEFAMSSNISRSSESDDAPPCSVSLCSFDFAGSGHSQGDIVTLGHRERADIRCVLDFLSAVHGYKKFALWGRSMGAVSALLFAENSPFYNCDLFSIYSADYDITCLVLDSPFADFKELTQDVISSIERNAQKVVNGPPIPIVQKQVKTTLSDDNIATTNEEKSHVKFKLSLSWRKKSTQGQPESVVRRNPGILAHIVATTGIPEFVSNRLVSMIRETVRKRANFDIFHLSPVSLAHTIKIPTLFLTALNDDVVPHHHGDELFERMTCPTMQVRFSGTHNSRRYGWLLKSCMEFVSGVFQMHERIESDEEGPGIADHKVDADGEEEEDERETTEMLLRRISLVIRYLLCVQQQQELQRRLRRVHSDERSDASNVIRAEQEAEEVRYRFGQNELLQAIHSSCLLPSFPAVLDISDNQSIDSDTDPESFDLIQTMINWFSFSTRSTPDSDAASDNQDDVSSQTASDHTVSSGIASPRSSVFVSNRLFRTFSSSSSSDHANDNGERPLRSPKSLGKVKDCNIENPIMTTQAREME